MTGWTYQQYMTQPEWFVIELTDFFLEVSKQQQESIKKIK
jgi:hypothetical protein